jgi:hypothetical protein
MGYPFSDDDLTGRLLAFVVGVGNTPVLEHCFVQSTTSEKGKLIKSTKRHEMHHVGTITVYPHHG